MAAKHICVVEPSIKAELEKHNTRIVHALCHDAKTSTMTAELLLTVEKIDRKKRVGPINLMCAYCPFCGEKLHPDE